MLRNWLVQELIGGATGIGSPSVDGLFMDDYWCSNLICAADPTVAGCPCNDPVQGATEIDTNQQVDMGLSDEDIRDITLAWNETMSAVENHLLESGAYSWWLIANQANANAMPLMMSKETCIAQLQEACSPSSSWQREPQLFGLTINSTAHSPQQLEQDVGFFLLARGDYAWLGWGEWGMTWPFNPEPAHGELPPLPDGVPRPALLDHDFGVPREICKETLPGVFSRMWTKGMVALDCNTFKVTLPVDVVV